MLNSDQHASAEYIKQLLLSVVDEVCQRAIRHQLVPGKFLVIQEKKEMQMNEIRLILVHVCYFIEVH